ncbi:MAG: hypothetical protein AB1486_29500 [Planctomycetota bacterium]
MRLLSGSLVSVLGLVPLIVNLSPSGGSDVACVLPVQFVRYPGNPVYEASGALWNVAGIGDPCVIWDEDEKLYKMWTSAGGVVPPETAIGVRIQYVTSPDGVTWTEHDENPVLLEGRSKGAWDRAGVDTATVLKLNGRYWMWYAGYAVREFPPVTMKIGLATSDDGIHWQKDDQNPVLASGDPGEWDESWVESPTVVWWQGQFTMWYTGVGMGGTSFAIGLATSPDGKVWTKHDANPVFEADPASRWDDIAVYAPSVVEGGAGLVMAYVGLSTAFLDELRIGLATSGDGFTWTRSPPHPVLDLGKTGSWDARGGFVPTLVRRGLRFEMWYVSFAAERAKIGLATWPR